MSIHNKCQIMKSVWAKHALIEQAWQHNVQVDINESGVISGVEVGVNANSSNAAERVGLLLPAPANLHSHAFQRAMAGLTETQGPDSRDTFWTWRQLMFSFLDRLNPDDIESITAYVQMEMLESGYAAVGEFHYLHHQPSGDAYDNPAEMCERIVSATQTTGIGLTLLPVLYEQGGCDGRALVAGQKRFANTPEQFAKLAEDAQQHLKQLPADTHSGVAPHSLRAVSQSGLSAAVTLAANRPIHLHVAEQVAEVEEIQAFRGARPVEWLLNHHDVGKNWCIIHATQMLPEETHALAKTDAVAGLCPITESSLGDGIFDGMRYQQSGGRFGVGSDSNIRISLAEELRTLEYSQRLRDKGRAMFAQTTRSTGRVLYDNVLKGGAQALQRNSGAIQAGQLADLLALDSDATDLIATSGDGWLDAWIFAGDDRLVSDVWSAGRHMVTGGSHINRETIEQRYRKTLKSILEDL